MDKKCLYCNERKNISNFTRSGSTYLLDGYGDYCYTCLGARIDPYDLNQVNKYLQYVDLPFHPNEWIELVESDRESALRTYCMKHQFTLKRREVDWTSVNEVWRRRRDEGDFDQKIAIVDYARAARLKEKWGDAYTPEEHDRMEELYEELRRSQPFTTPTQEDQARMLCKASIDIHRKLERGEDFTKSLTSYNNTIKAGGFTAENVRDYNSLESVGELINFLVKKGYTPNGYDRINRDEVDFTIANQQNFLRRLVLNEPSLAEQVAQRQEAYRISQEMEDDGIDDDALDHFEDAGFNLEFEGGDEFDAEFG